MENEEIKEKIKKLLTDNPKEEIFNKIKKLLEMKSSHLSELIPSISNFPGVYLIYKGEYELGGFIYVGETDDLKRRLKGDLSRGKKRYHSFLNKLSKKFNLSEESLKKIIEKDYTFSFVETSSKEMAFVIEGILTSKYYAQLDNSKKKYFSKE